MSARPLVTVYDASTATAQSTVAMPTVFSSPIRPDVVRFVHTNMAKNRRQPYAVSEMAGHQTSAESWGTGRAVARIPRVSGGGTHRAGQAAFGNMCRSGRMFAPTKTWRRWHHQSNLTQRRFAVASALAASAVSALVMARGHRVENVVELPLVVSKGAESISHTKDAIKLLKSVGAFADVERADASRKVRSGKGKMRNRRFVQRRGPLVVYGEDHGITRAFRNVPGVEICNVTRLNLLQLAPGAHVGRFIVWTETAFNALDGLYGAGSKKAGAKTPAAPMASADISRIMRSEEVRAVLKPRQAKAKRVKHRKNALTNLGALVKLNPYAKVARRAALITERKAVAAKTAKPVKVAKTA